MSNVFFFLNGQKDDDASSFVSISNGNVKKILNFENSAEAFQIFVWFLMYAYYNFKHNDTKKETKYKLIKN